MKRTVALTYDLKTDWQPKDTDPHDLNAEFDPPYTVDQIVAAIESKGYTVQRIGNVHNLLSNLDKINADIVFNIAEGYYGRNRESQVPVLLELKGIPYVGSDGLTLSLTLDKIAAKKFFIAEGIPTPKFFEARSSENLEALNTIGYPLIVKARYEGSSKGISENSKVDDIEGLRRQVDLINGMYKQPALVEEFIRGKEFTVAVLGNENPEPMPVIQTKIEGKLDLGDAFYTFRHISSDEVEYICPAQIDAALEQKLRDIAVRVYKCVDCRDFGRVDFRVDKQGNPYVLEINPLPCLSKDDVFFFIAKVLGVSYEDMIHRILLHGLERYGLTQPREEEDLSESTL